MFEALLIPFQADLYADEAGMAQNHFHEFSSDL